MFQSSPTSKGGRYSGTNELLRMNAMFQSSPTSKGGRYLEREGARAVRRSVSILAHLER